MSFKFSLVFIVIMNLSLMFLFFGLSQKYNWDIESMRLKDIALSNPKDLKMLGAFVAVIVSQFFFNLLAFGAKRTHFYLDEVRKMMEHLNIIGRRGTAG